MVHGELPAHLILDHLLDVRVAWDLLTNLEHVHRLINLLSELDQELILLWELDLDILLHRWLLHLNRSLLFDDLLLSLLRSGGFGSLIALLLLLLDFDLPLDLLNLPVELLLLPQVLILLADHLCWLRLLFLHNLW